MARIAGVDLPPAKRAEIGLTYIYGVGRTRSRSLLYRAGIDFDRKVRDLTEEEVNRVRQILEEERTHTNARTRKGPRRGTVANKKKAAAKT
jgi:small subunit ribosomal protein S13